MGPVAPQTPTGPWQAPRLGPSPLSALPALAALRGPFPRQGCEQRCSRREEHGRHVQPNVEGRLSETGAHRHAGRPVGPSGSRLRRPQPVIGAADSHRPERMFRCPSSGAVSTPVETPHSRSLSALLWHSFHLLSSPHVTGWARPPGDVRHPCLRRKGPEQLLLLIR